MNRIILLLAVVSAFFQGAVAQKSIGKTEKEVLIEMRKEAIREVKSTRPILGNADAPGSTAAEVGDPDSFGKTASFMGIAQSGVIYVYSSCDPAVLLTDLGLELGPDDRCLAAPNPAVTSTAVFTDVARITIPARTAKNVFYLINNHSISWDFFNGTASPFPGRMSYSPRITIESDALNDPAAIDPVTGLPMGGSFTTTGSGSKSLGIRLQPGDFSNYFDSYSRANTSGLSRTYFAQLGLPTSVINNIYSKPMTIRLGAGISVRGVEFGQFVYTTRILGN